MDKINHLHLLLRAECRTAPGPDDEQKIYNKVVNLIQDVKMKVFMEPKVKYMPDLGNEGLTYLAGLETSHTSAHFWDKPNKEMMTFPDATLLQMDMYTCGCMGEEEIKEIMKFIGEYSPKQVSVAVFDRSRADTFFEPIIKIKYNEKSKGAYFKFLNDLTIQYTNSYKKKFFKVA